MRPIVGGKNSCGITRTWDHTDADPQIERRDITADQSGRPPAACGPGAYTEDFATPSIAADPVVQYMDQEQLKKLIRQTRKSMEKAARELDFIEAARLRDEVIPIGKMVNAH